MEAINNTTKPLTYFETDIYLILVKIVCEDVVFTGRIFQTYINNLNISILVIKEVWLILYDLHNSYNNINDTIRSGSIVKKLSNDVHIIVT